MARHPMIGQRDRGLDREYPKPSHISEADLLRGYRGLRDQQQGERDLEALRRAELALHADGTAVPEPLLLRGRRCPCGGHGR